MRPQNKVYCVSFLSDLCFFDWIGNHWPRIDLHKSALFDTYIAFFVSFFNFSLCVLVTQKKLCIRNHFFLPFPLRFPLENRVIFQRNYFWFSLVIFSLFQDIFLWRSNHYLFHLVFRWNKSRSFPWISSGILSWSNFKCALYFLNLETLSLKILL